MVGRWFISFRVREPIFRGKLAVSFREFFVFQTNHFFRGRGCWTWGVQLLFQELAPPQFEYIPWKMRKWKTIFFQLKWYRISGDIHWFSGWVYMWHLPSPKGQYCSPAPGVIPFVAQPSCGNIWRVLALSRNFSLQRTWRFHFLWVWCLYIYIYT